MATIELVNRRLTCNSDELDTIVRENCHNLTITGFNDENEAKVFISLFPKYVKLKIGTMSSYKFNGSIPCVSFRIESVNNRTGLINETGDKRIKALIKYLIKYCG